MADFECLETSRSRGIQRWRGYCHRLREPNSNRISHTCRSAHATQACSLGELSQSPCMALLGHRGRADYHPRRNPAPPRWGSLHFWILRLFGRVQGFSQHRGGTQRGLVWRHPSKMGSSGNSLRTCSGGDRSLHQRDWRISSLRRRGPFRPSHSLASSTTAHRLSRITRVSGGAPPPPARRLPPRPATQEFRRRCPS